MLQFSSKSFIVSGIISRSLIHCELISVRGDRECFTFILLHETVQFSQHQLLKTVFSPLCILASFVSKWENILVNSNQQGINLQSTQIAQYQKITTQSKNGQIYIDISPKKTYRWLTNAQKDVQHC